MADKSSAARRSDDIQDTTPESQETPVLRLVREFRVAAASPLDSLIHEQMRLGIVSTLAVNPSMTFNDLKTLLNTTDGNLSVHARKLEDAGYVTCSKSFEGRVPRTEYRLTEAGRAALERYLTHMDALIQAVRR